jgi:hypothetical protein
MRARVEAAAGARQRRPRARPEASSCLCLWWQRWRWSSMRRLFFSIRLSFHASSCENWLLSLRFYIFRHFICPYAILILSWLGNSLARTVSCVPTRPRVIRGVSHHPTNSPARKVAHGTHALAEVDPNVPTKLGPGQMPARPQPVPNVAAPTSSRLSTFVFVGNPNESFQRGLPPFNHN